ncbi:MAG: hypothetical protein ACREBE_12860, partial [bacterium]
AADVSGDGRITLGEAYQFSFNETLAQTTTTQAGAQHPAYDIKMAGTGDVVLTDVRQISSSLILGEQYAGRFFVLNNQHHLVAELYKPNGRKVELGLEPGAYEVYFEQDEQLLMSNLQLAEGQRQDLSRDGLRTARRLPTQRRGGGPSEQDRDLLDGRSRLESSLGLAKGQDGPDRLTFLHWINPEVSLEFALAAFDIGKLDGFLFGSRYYPALPGSVRPYLGVAVGTFKDNTGTVPHVGPRPTRGAATVGAGVDFFSGRDLTGSVDGHATAMVGGARRFDLALTIGWTFGRGRLRTGTPTAAAP